MKSFYTAAALLTATVSADLCPYGSTDDDNNFYCHRVESISYVGIGAEGSYNRVTSMNDGACTSSAYGYNGSLSPLDEQLSVHFRGPLQLKQFAFYAPAAAAPSYGKEKREAGRRNGMQRRHAHGQTHQHLHHARGAHAEEKREPAVGDTVHALIDGVMETWKNTYSGNADGNGNADPAPSYDSGTGSTGPSGSAPPSHGQSSSSSTSSHESTQTSSNDNDDDSSSNGTGWTRQGYYNAETQDSDGIVFLNHEGGSGSGVFDYSFGNSLSYASKDGKSGASGPTTLEDCTLASDTEVIIMTDNKCGDDGGCGYSRPGTVAYSGFDGPSKAFFFEFSMPDDGTAAASKYVPTNMPAVWLLNAQIPRTLQYGNAECSCWATGCGEFDIFEVLAPGDTRCKSTLHGNVSGGDSDYFERPTNKTIKAAVLLYKDNIHIKILDDSTNFGKTMGDSFISEMVADTMAQSLESLVSVFKLSA